MNRSIFGTDVEAPYRTNVGAITVTHNWPAQTTTAKADGREGLIVAVGVGILAILLGSR